MTNTLYQTPDGSVWEVRVIDGEIVGDRLESPGGEHENDFRAQKLSEIVKHWGALNTYDPIAIPTKKFIEAANLNKVGIAAHVVYAILETLYAEGWKLTRE